LLDRVADINHAGESHVEGGASHALIAAMLSDEHDSIETREKVLHLLLESGADSNVKDESTSVTPIILAAINDCAESIKLLKKYGANINAAANNGTTALIYAAERNNMNSVRVLVELNADLLMKDRHGLTALDTSIKVENKAISEFLYKSLETDSGRH